jgi:hypothetical protein
MRLPLLKNSSVLPSRGLRGACPICRKKLPKNAVAIMGGALRVTDRKRQRAEMAEDLVGYLSILWHEGRAASLVEWAPRGQFDIYLCSTKCLRTLFSAWVDALEACK